MKISGFTMAKNASKLYYPIKAAIESILPIVDEFIVALGDNDPDDNTEQLIKEIKSDKVKIIHTKWDINKYPRGMENAHQTDIAKEACSGDWLFYLQADEVVHEKYLQNIYDKCLEKVDDHKVEGFLFNYLHFFGDYSHFVDHHGWYPREIRIIRNDPDIHSYKSAQSFRRIPNFDGLNYRQKEDTFKLNVLQIDAYIYHYGWVRPPEFMQAKSKSLDSIHHGKNKMDEAYSKKHSNFDYGNMNLYKTFKDTHPEVMKDFISKFNWGDELHFEKNYIPQREPMKHERFKYRLLTFIEQNLMGGHPLFGHSNWNIIKD